MHLGHDSHGKSSFEWSALAVVLLTASLTLASVGNAARSRIAIDGSATDAAGTQSQGDAQRNAARPGYSEPSSARPVSHGDTDGPAEADATTEHGGAGAVAFLSELLVATRESFVEAAIDLVPSMIETVELAAALAAHEARAAAELGVRDYAEDRISIALDIAGVVAVGAAAVLSDPAAAAHAVMEEARVLKTRAGYYADAIRSGRMSGTTVGRMLGPALLELAVDRVLFRPVARNAKVLASVGRSGLSMGGSGVLHHAHGLWDGARKLGAHLNPEHLLKRTGDAPPWEGMFVFLRTRKMKDAAERWPSIFDKEGNVLVPTSHRALLLRLAESGENDDLLEKAELAARGVVRGRFFGTEQFTSTDALRKVALDSITSFTWGKALLRTLLMRDSIQYVRALGAYRAYLSPTLFPPPTPREIMQWARLRNLEFAPGRSLLDVPEGNTLAMAVAQAREKQWYLDIATAVQEPRPQRIAAMARDFVGHDRLLHDLAINLKDVALRRSIAGAVTQHRPWEHIDADLLALSNRHNFLRVIKVERGAEKVEERSAGRDELARRVAEIAHEHRRMTGESFLPSLAKDDNGIWLYARDVRNADLDIDVSRTFWAWREKSGPVYLLEEGVTPPRGLSVPPNAVALNDLLHDQDSIFQFLRLVH